MRYFFKQFFTFTCHHAISCVFAVVIFAALALTQHYEISFIPRYDLILLICVVAQFLMIIFKYETLDELKVICIFHIIGLALELYKIHMGSWSYPEFAYTKIGGVPLYSGFMYASVASYACQAWRRFDIHVTYWPSRILTYTLAALIYLNFFTHHFLPDIRWLLILSLPFIYWKSWINFRVNQAWYKMPVVGAFLLVAFFIWLAENIATFLGAWKYPNQTQTWQMVDFSKFSSWFLLVIITIIIVANLKHLKSRLNVTRDEHADRN